MLPEDGPVVASPDVPPHAWAEALSGAASLIVLAPGSARGWFGGRAVVAWAPEFTASCLTLPEAAAELQCAYADEDTPCLAVAMLPYTGAATAARYSGGIVHTPEGWRTWGDLNPSDVPVPGFGAPPAVAPCEPLAFDVVGDMGEGEFVAGVRAIGDAIRAGDVYVVNLTRRLVGTPAMLPARAFAALVQRTGAEMAAFWRMPDGPTIASASPERFLRVRERQVDVCPIKGTRPRGDGGADAAMRAELAASLKERAEHVMIVDLERNDLGRVCEAGTIRVDPLFEIETATYCHQMVSTVSGVLRRAVSIAELLDATFPCGSVTGAPKIAAMRAIDRLEASPRGAYTGSLVVAVPGEVDSSVLIRTAEYADGRVAWGTGGGITVDSDAHDEWLETVLKASPFTGDGSAGAA